MTKQPLKRIIDNAINVMQTTKQHAIYERKAVAVAIVTRDDNIFGGCNFENYLKKTYHAEEVALISAMTQGYKTTDFWFMVQEIFPQDTLYPACLSCLAFLWEYTHPSFLIYIVKDDTAIHLSTLGALTSGYGGVEIFPSEGYRKLKRIHGYEGQL